jgi:hypothetical protein
VAKGKKTSAVTAAQPYPRILDRDSQYYGCLDDSTLVQHQIKIPVDEVKAFIRLAIEDANKKSSRVILSIPADESPEKIAQKYRREGKKLLEYFKKYCVDPAATAYQIQGKHYTIVGEDLFRRRTLQKERMNAGWRYQYLTLYCARETGRFDSVSDIGTKEADFNAIVGFLDNPQAHLNLFVSVKNRRNTVGGQDFPKAVRALEAMASSDKNRRGPYLCVFGIAMDRGTRHIRRDREGREYSANTEVWLSDYFWPFFTNYSYEEIMTLVLEVLEELHELGDLATQVEVPTELLEAFGAACLNAGLLDETGCFNDARKIVSFICSSQQPVLREKKEKKPK